MAKTLTLGELAQVEQITGYTYGDENTPRGKLFAALVFVLQKRQNPDFKLEDAWNMDAQEASDIVNGYFGDDDDPK